MTQFDARSVTGPQLRAARALLGISAAELARLAKLGVATIKRAEQSAGPTSMTAANAERVVAVLYEAGVEFIAENGNGAGVRFIRGRN